MCRRSTKYSGSIPCGIQRRMSHPQLLQRGFRNYFRSRMDAKNVSNIMRDLSRGPWTFVFIGCGQVSRRGVVENFKVIHNKISFIRNILNINTNKSTQNCCFWSTCVMKFQLSYQKAVCYHSEFVQRTLNSHAQNFRQS